MAEIKCGDIVIGKIESWNAWDNTGTVFQLSKIPEQYKSEFSTEINIERKFDWPKDWTKVDFTDSTNPIKMYLSDYNIEFRSDPKALIVEDVTLMYESKET